MKCLNLSLLGLIVVAGSALLALSGCDSLSKFIKVPGAKSAASSNSASSPGADSSAVQGGAVLVRAFGKDYVTEEPFQKKLAQMLQASPYTRGVDPSMLPAEAKINFLKDWVNFLLIKDVWGKDNGVEDSAEFQRKFAEHVEAFKDSLIIDAFVQEIKKSLTVSESEVKKEFETNKDRYVKTPGGNEIFTARTNNLDDARALQKRARKAAKSDEFKALVDDVVGAHYQSHDYLSTASDKATVELPEKVWAVATDKDCARSTMVEDGEDAWVIFCADKKKADYFAFAEIKDQVRGMLEEMRHKEAIDKELEKMREKAQVEFVGGALAQNVQVLTPEQLAQAVKVRESAEIS